ncbi:acyltransferase [Nocardioides baekrokdamisoli]|uniref:Acyltransferase n=1 Tax=Nocardioides baekrokdamisoli TaxID=1804624 RepID=A0A3G9IKA2_9ACTN|nr:acyltransferase family protein [Nocardioides baekrokdamisoli]BBH18602.1 acyltransferase [Nocardioides baekrokdamisoli]
MGVGGSDRTRVAGLDSLRAVAVVAVVAYHLTAPGFGGGFLGVTLFFVISGYLITRLLLNEIGAAGRLDLRSFWIRRVRRLFPALLVLVLLCLTVALLFAPASLHRIRGDALASMTYSSNWWMIFHHISYFDSFALPSPLTHLWTLAIEEQFYLLWPLVLVVLLAVLRRPGRILFFLGLAVVASFAVMAVLYRAADPNRSYMGTDARMGELLIGAALAVWMHLAPNGSVTSRSAAARRVRGWWACAIGLGSAGVYAALTITLSDRAAFTYRGGILLAAVSSVGLILALQDGALSRLVGRFDCGVLGAVGRRSYGIYLWHYPILIALSSPLTFGTFYWARSAAVVGLTMVTAEVSYRFVEMPIRRRGFRNTLRGIAARLRGMRTVPRRVVVGATLAMVIVPGVALAGVGVPQVDHGPITVLMGSHPGEAPAVTQSATPDHGVSGRSGAHPSAESSAMAQPKSMTGPDTVAVGDSLLIDIAGRLQRKVPGISINAEIGRQPWTGLSIADTYTQFNRPGGTYLLGIGTNGAIDPGALTDFVRRHAHALILLVTPRVNRPWESASVRAIWKVSKFPNVRVVDFHNAAAGHPEYFGPDGVHLTDSGIRAMVALILAAGGRR